MSTAAVVCLVVAFFLLIRGNWLTAAVAVIISLNV